MQSGIIRSIVIAGSVLSLSGIALAQSTQSPSSSKPPDFSGVWTRRPIPPPSNISKPPPGSRGGAGNPDAYGFTAEIPTLTPWGEQQYKLVRTGTKDPYEMKPEPPDTELYPYCLPGGFPRVYTVPFPFRIVQTPDLMVMIFEYEDVVRQIYLDGRKHAAGEPTTFAGNSVGHWEGDTLVVETTDIDPISWIDNLGHPHSDALRVIERIQRPSQDALQIDFTFDDPKAYTKPWTGKKLFRLMPADTEIGEFSVCEDYLKQNYLDDVKKGKMQGRP
jgi:hypothetical protein